MVEVRVHSPQKGSGVQFYPSEGPTGGWHWIVWTHHLMNTCVSGQDLYTNAQPSSALVVTFAEINLDIKIVIHTAADCLINRLLLALYYYDADMKNMTAVLMDKMCLCDICIHMNCVFL